MMNFPELNKLYLPGVSKNDWIRVKTTQINAGNIYCARYSDYGANP
jgi:hypothetical protein